MQVYPEVPTWFYICAGVLGSSFSTIATQVWHSGSPFWVPIGAIALVTVYLLPCVMLFATTGYTVCLFFPPIDQHPILIGFTQIQLDLLSQVIPGVLIPGNPMANMVIVVSTHGVEVRRLTGV